MGLTGKLIMSLDIRSRGDMIYDILRYRPNEFASVSPGKILGCKIYGQLGATGSFRHWNFINDGKNQTSKEIIEEADDTNHKIVLKVIEGDLLGDLYNSFKLLFHVEPKGDGHLAIWTLEFEKLNTSVPYPTTVMDLLLDVTKDMDVHVSH